MSPPAHINTALTSSGVNMSCGTVTWMSNQNAMVISVTYTFSTGCSGILLTIGCTLCHCAVYDVQNGERWLTLYMLLCVQLWYGWHNSHWLRYSVIWIGVWKRLLLGVLGDDSDGWGWVCANKELNFYKKMLWKICLFRLGSNYLYAKARKKRDTDEVCDWLLGTEIQPSHLKPRKVWNLQHHIYACYFCCSYVVRKATVHVSKKVLTMNHQGQKGFRGIFVWILQH